MRVTGGRARGIPLQVPRGARVRPATDRTREAVFSAIASHVPAAVFADLFAGSGSYGLEALSRGAAAGCFVENDPEALACLRRNLAAVTRSLGLPDAPPPAAVLRADVLRSEPTTAANLIFADPPYPLTRSSFAAILAAAARWAAGTPQPMLVLELPGDLVDQRAAHSRDSAALADSLNRRGGPFWRCSRILGSTKPDAPAVAIWQRRETAVAIDGQ